MKQNRAPVAVLLALAAMAAILFRGCRPVSRMIALKPARVVTGVDGVTLRVIGKGFEPGMKVRVGDRVLAAAFLGAGELTCSLPRACLLPGEGAAPEETISVCVLDGKENEYSDTAFLTLDRQYDWRPTTAPPALDSASGGPRLFVLGEKTLLLVARNGANEVRGTLSVDSGMAWGAASLLHAGEAADGIMRFVFHPATGVASVTSTAAGIVFRPLVGPSGGSPALPAVVLPRAAAALRDLSAYCDRLGGLHIAWLDFSPVERFTFHYASSADGGANWNGPFQIREVANPQPDLYTLDHYGLAIEGADGDGRIYLTVRSSYHYRDNSESMLSRDHGLTWTVAADANRTSAGSVVTAAATLVLGGTLIVGSYPAVSTAALLNLSSDWGTGWQERPFLGTDWVASQPSGVVVLRGDRWDNLLLAAWYNKSGDDVQKQAFFRSVDAGATWGQEAPWAEGMPRIKNLADLAIDGAGNAFALFPGSSGWLLFQAPACSE
jgi:hypothetical protein